MIELRYKCYCSPEERVLAVREREPGEDIRRWMKQIAVPQLTADHRKRSPLCQSAAMEYMKIPMDEDAPIGSKHTRH